jgi:hypothetical protein
VVSCDVHSSQSLTLFPVVLLASPPCKKQPFLHFSQGQSLVSAAQTHWGGDTS